MHWTLLNGSPRGKRANTAVVLQAVARGLAASGCTVELHHLAVPAQFHRAPELCARAGRLLVGFPLYTDAMPGILMELFEQLAPLQSRRDKPAIAFLVQSGFPEPGQSRPVERYLELLCQRQGCRYLGTIVKGGVEGIQAMPAWLTRKLMRRLEKIGRTLGSKDRLEAKELRELAGAEWLKGWRGPILRLMLSLGSTPHWNRTLKQNGAFAQRFARVY
jgi:hypothetical protein